MTAPLPPGAKELGVLVAIVAGVGALLFAATFYFSRLETVPHVSKNQEQSPAARVASTGLAAKAPRSARSHVDAVTPGSETQGDPVVPGGFSPTRSRDVHDSATAQSDQRNSPSPPPVLPLATSKLPRDSASAVARPRTPTVLEDEPADNAASDGHGIQGRVLSEAGAPLPGVELTASAIRLFASVGKPDRPLAPTVYYAVSDFTGAFQFWDLAAGEYRVKTSPFGFYASEQKMVRTGGNALDIVLVWQQEMTVFGVVRGRDGEPLGGVQVTALSSPPYTALSDDQGRYEVMLSLRANRSNFAVRFKHAGYRDQRLEVEVNEPDALAADLELDAIMEPSGALATVRGVITDPAGQPIAGETVSLSSPSLRRSRQGRSDRQGRYTVTDVEPAADYRLLVAANGPYRDHRKKDFEITARGLTVDLVLQPFVLGRLAGQMVDMEGYPVPNFSMTLKSRTAVRRSLQIRGDERGNFNVDDIPEGMVELRTESTPRLNISGLRASRDVKEPVTVVLDLGRFLLRGWVTDRRGNPVPTARVNVRMAHVEHGVRSFSARDAVSDAEGYFEFSGLGAGVHTVRVSASEFVTTEFDTDVGIDDDQLTVGLDDK